MQEAYNYTLPEELVGTKPAEPRDSARLFVYDTGSDKVSFDIFANLDKYLPKKSLLVLNDTKVVPARVTLYKETGGKVIALFLMNEYRGGDSVRVLLDRGTSIGAMLCFGTPPHLSTAVDRCGGKEEPSRRLQVVGQEENVFILKPEFAVELLPRLLEQYGAMPLPPYLKGVTLSETELRSRYQTVFASRPASVAAPTASLHFTPRVFEKLEGRGIETAYVTLHVGLGTFAPLTSENLKTGTLHFERYEVPEESARKIQQAKNEKRNIVAVGTTAVRTLESSAFKILANLDGRRDLLKGDKEDISDETNLFIKPPYEFKLVDSLITNFHIPKSSLMMLVDAFLQHKKAKRSILDLYKIAIAEKFRFFSFGDAMLIL